VIYELIGKLVVAFVWRRYGTQIKIGVGAGVLALLVGGYLAAGRDAPEG
jgi:hypothetical protein